MLGTTSVAALVTNSINPTVLRYMEVWVFWDEWECQHITRFFNVLCLSVLPRPAPRSCYWSTPQILVSDWRKSLPHTNVVNVETRNYQWEKRCVGILEQFRAKYNKAVLSSCHQASRNAETLQLSDLFSRETRAE